MSYQNRRVNIFSAFKNLAFNLSSLKLFHRTPIVVPFEETCRIFFFNRKKFKMKMKALKF